jgi:hypothetical protein
VKPLQRLLSTLLGGDKASALLGDIEEEAARLHAGRWWTAAEIALLFRDSLSPAAAGLACGLLVSVIGGRLIRAVVCGVSSHDPVAIAAAVVILVIATVSAVLVPARRAVRVSPAHLLKQG